MGHRGSCSGQTEDEDRSVQRPSRSHNARIEADWFIV